MFVRQKYLLAYLLASGGETTKLKLVKGLFCFCQQLKEKKLYDFHPYKYGPYSELLYVDLRAMERKGLLELNSEKVISRLNQERKQGIIKDVGNEHFYEIQKLASHFASMDFEAVLDDVYKQYPYYAINNERKKPQFTKYDPRLSKDNQGAVIFSLGYEGITVDAFIDRLIQNNIQTLVDVRNNPRSMKYGFTESTLKRLCEERGIEYISVKTLGIKGENRQHLETDEDYKILFEVFEREHMPNCNHDLAFLKSLLDKGKRIGLMCFEADICHCHREVVARHLYKFCKQQYELQHLS